MSVKKIGDGSPAAAAKFLRDNGLLFEINRKVLHPLGLALEVVCERDEQTGESKEVLGFGGLWDCRDDPEGVLFGSETFADGFGKYEKYMVETGGKNTKKRLETLGFLEQEPEETVFDGEA